MIELEGLIKNNTWKIVYRCDIPTDAKILNGRFVLTINEERISKEIWKEICFVRRNRAGMKNASLHNKSLSRQQSTKLIVGLPAMFWSDFYSSYVTRAYWYSSEKLMRNVYLNPGKELNLKPNQLTRLLKALYGLSESGDYRGRTIRKHLQNGPGMKSYIFDAV